MIRTLRHDHRGGVSLLFAAGLPMLLGFTAFAVDLGSAALESRKLQGIADAAAMAAASDPGNAQALAQASVTAAGWPRAITVQATSGAYTPDPAKPVAQRFTANAAASDAVRVSLQTPSPAFFARIFGQNSIPLSRTATAARERMASLSVGSRLAALNGGLLNAYLTALTGSSVSLSVMDYNGLANADVDLFSFLSALRTTAHLGAGTFQDTLNAQVTMPQLLDALAVAAPGQASALHGLSAQIPGGSLSLAALIDAGPLAKQTSGGTGIAKVNAMAMVTAALQTASPKRQVSLDLGASIAGLASTKLSIAIGERPQGSPWIAISETGTPIVRTAQARIYIEVQVGTSALPGLSGLVNVKVPVFVELATGQARLNSIDCSSQATRGVTVEAQPGLGDAAIAALDTSKLGDFSQPMRLSDARIVDTLLVAVDGRADLNLGSAEPWQTLRFDSPAIAAGTIQTVSSGNAVSGVAQSLAKTTKLKVTVKLLGLSISLTPLTQALGSVLGLLAPAVDGLVDVATGAIGVHYGQADVRVTGMRCGTAALIA
jgi:uncharacterized membrane protein